MAAGVSALKIEGRYKDAEYVALTTQAYRKAVDDAWAGQEHHVSRAEELQLEQVYSRGLGPYFVSGTNHQKVVQGRVPRHRGILMGRVAQVEADYVVVAMGEAHEIAPLKEGDGLVFDAADWRSPGEPEEGGRVYEATCLLDGNLLLRFANRAIRFDRIRPGDLVWRSSDSQVTQAARQFTEAAGPVRRQRVHGCGSGRMQGSPLLAEWSLVEAPDTAVSVSSAEPLATAVKIEGHLDRIAAGAVQPAGEHRLRTGRDFIGCGRLAVYPGLDPE